MFSYEELYSRKEEKGTLLLLDKVSATPCFDLEKMIGFYQNCFDLIIFFMF